MQTKAETLKPFDSAIAKLWACTLTFAAFGAAGWLLTYWPTSKALAFLFAGVFLMAPIVAAGLTGPVMKAKPWAVLLIAPGIFGFAAMDALGNANAFWQFEKIAMSEKVRAFNADTDAITKSAEADLMSATSALASIALPVRDCLCPKTREADLAVFNAQRGPHLAAQTQAKGILRDALTRQAPGYHLVSPWVSGAVFALISFTLIAGFLGVHRAKDQALSEWYLEKGKQAKRRARNKKPKASQGQGRKLSVVTG